MTSVSPFFYAKAFRKALDEGKVSEEKLVHNLSHVVGQRGQMAQWPRIVGRVSEELVHYHKGRWIRVETPRPLTNAQRKKIEGAFSKKDYIEEHVRSELVAGLRILVDGEQEFDGSLKRKLDMIFNSK